MIASAHPSAQRFEFAPPPTAGLLRSLSLAILAHAVLVAALTWGVQWKRDAVTVTAEAELWASVPEAAAPKLIDAPKVSIPAPTPASAVDLPPIAAPIASSIPAPVAPSVFNPSIAIEQDKKRLLEAKRLQDERAAQEKKQIDQKRAQEKALKLEKALALEKENDKRLGEDRKLAEDKKKADQKLALTKQAALVDAKKTEDQRLENIKRITGLAGAAGSAGASGAALQAAGPSPGYTGRIIGRIRPNIVFTEDVSGNPQTVVEVRVAPDGTILSRNVIKASGNRAWDEAVLKAIDKTEILPRDVDGRVPPSMEITFRAKN